MNFFEGTVSLIELDNIHLAVSLADTLMIGQGSEVALSEDRSNIAGSFKYADTNLPTYFLNDKLLPSDSSEALNKSQFCIGLRTTQETDYFVLLCKQFEQIEISEQTHRIQELPDFMCREKMLVEGVFQHQEKVYLMTKPDKLLNYLVSNVTDHKQESDDV
jgi:hypothetical protein